MEVFIKKHKGKVRYLVVLDHDRFSRNLPEALLKIDQLEKKFGLKVIATNESLDIDPNDPAVFIQRAFKYLVANQELFTISRRAKLGIRQAQLSGRYVNKAPLGYLNAKETGGKGVMKVDESNAFIIKKIFRDYLSGIPPYLIGQEAVKLGFKHTGNGAIARFLRNPLYAGLVRVSATEKEPERFVKGLHQPIISPQQYWRAQELLDNKRLVKSHPKEEFPLKGVIRSPCCGRVMTAGWSKGKYKRYMYDRCVKHTNMNIPGILLHDKFDELLGFLNFSQSQIDTIINRVKTGLKEVLLLRKMQLGVKKKELETIEAKIDRMEEKFINNEIKKETFEKWSRKYTIKKSALTEEIRHLKPNFQGKMEKELSVLPTSLI